LGLDACRVDREHVQIDSEFTISLQLFPVLLLYAVRESVVEGLGCCVHCNTCCRGAKSDAGGIVYDCALSPLSIGGPLAEEVVRHDQLGGAVYDQELVEFEHSAGVEDPGSGTPYVVNKNAYVNVSSLSIKNFGELARLLLGVEEVEVEDNGLRLHIVVLVEVLGNLI